MEISLTPVLLIPVYHTAGDVVDIILIAMHYQAFWITWRDLKDLLELPGDKEL